MYGKDFASFFFQFFYDSFIVMGMNPDGDDPLSSDFKGRGNDTDQVDIIVFYDIEDLMQLSRFILEGEG